MTFAQIMHPLRAAYKAPVADGRSFVKKILIPHIFILVLFILLGTLLNENPTNLLIRLISLAYPAFFTLWINFSDTLVSLRFVAVYLSILVTLLLVALLGLSLDPILLLYAPYITLAVALSALGLSYRDVILAVMPSYILLLIVDITCLLLGIYQEYSFLIPVMGVVLLVVLLIISKIFLLQGRFGRSDENVLSYQSPTAILVRRQENASAFVEAARWLDAFRHARNVELARESLWRLLLVAITAHILLVVTYSWPQISLLLGCLVSLALVLFQGLLFNRLRGDSNKESVLFRLFIFVVLSFLPSLMVISSVSEVPIYVKVLFLVTFALSMGLLYWDKTFALLLYLLSLSSVILLFFHSSALFPLLIVASLILIVIYRTSIIGYFGIVTRSAASLLGRYSLLYRDPKEVMDLFSLAIAEIGEVDTSLIISSSGKAYTLTSKNENQIAAEIPLVQTLIELVCDLQGSEGLLSTDKLSEQLKGFLLDSFGSVPARLMYFMTNGIVNEREETLVTLLSVTPTIKIYGVSRFIRSAATLFVPINLSISSVRGQIISSDHFESQQRSISEREEEINEMVHLVNNSAQDIAIHCEAICQELGDPDLANNLLSSKSEKIFDQIKQIDISAKTLSEGVSDIKLVRELMSLKNLEQIEVVAVGRLLEELENFARHRAKRKGEEFNLIVDLKEDQAVQVASRDFMQTVLRLLVRIAGRRFDGSGRVEVSVFKEENNIAFIIRDNGRVVSEETRAAVGLTFHPSHSGVHGEEYLRAVGDFARFSKGKFSFESPSSEYGNSMKLTLPAAELIPTKVVTPGQWALLVDDNRQVTTFYARVAEALKLRSFTAVSVSEAKEILTLQGKPRLVITDIQLDGSSGIDVVRDVRERYGVEVPIVVVSGQADEAVSREVLQAGATKCLLKPVGRRKLFAEIEEIL